MKRFVIGPMFTPPSVRSDDPAGKKGSIVVPGVYGGSNWNNGAFDPDTGMYYAVSHTLPWVYDLVKPTDPKATMEYAIDVGRGPSTRHTDIKGPQGLPLTKPPYGRITAYDMNKGDKVWTVANGDGPRESSAAEGSAPAAARHPGPAGAAPHEDAALHRRRQRRGLQLGRRRQVPRLRQGDGQVVWETDLPAGTTGAPMTYMANGQQYILVPVGSKAHDAEWVAFSLASR